MKHQLVGVITRHSIAKRKRAKKMSSVVQTGRKICSSSNFCELLNVSTVEILYANADLHTGRLEIDFNIDIYLCIGLSFPKLVFRL